MKLNPALTPYLKLMRFPAVFTAWSNVIAAQIIAMNGEPLWITLFILMLSTSLLYLGGMILNDCFDYSVDKKERPFRPLPSGAISRNRAWLLGALFMVAGTLTAGLLGKLQLIIALCLVLTILFYNALAKNTIIGIKAMASCRYLNWLLALSVGGLTFTDLLIPVPIALYIMAVTLLSQDETSASNNAIINLVMVLIMTVYAAIACLIAIGIFDFPGSLFFTTVAAALLMRTLWQLKDHYTPENIQNTMTILITCIIPLDALMLLSDGQTGWALVVLALLIPSKKIGKWIYTT